MGRNHAIGIPNPNLFNVLDFFDQKTCSVRFMSQEGPEHEIVDMRHQIAELKAEAAQTDSEDKDAARSGWS